MSFDGKNPFRVLRQTWNPGGYEIETLAGDRVLKHDDAQMIGLDPADAGGRNVDLPAPRAGAWFWIFNRADGAENLTVRQADGSTSLVTINQNESAIVFASADDADASASGWSLMAVVAIALS